MNQGFPVLPLLRGKYIIEVNNIFFEYCKGNFSLTFAFTKQRGCVKNHSIHLVDLYALNGHEAWW